MGFANDKNIREKKAISVVVLDSCVDGHIECLGLEKQGFL
jgi:hypothetical protein